MKILLLIIFFLFAITGGASAQSRQQFKAIVDNIIGDPSEILYYGDFAYYPPFIKLSDQKEKILPPCLDPISDSNASDQEEIIAIMLANKISPKNYVVFLEKIFIMYKIGRLNENEFFTALFPEHPLNDIITNNYKIPSERALLSKIILCHCVSKNLSHLLFDVLTGYQYKRQQEFYRECCTTYKFKIW